MTTITREYFRGMAGPSLSRSASASDYVPDVSSAASSVQSASFSTLARIAGECGEAGWDGYDAKPLSHSTCDRARAFLKVLPTFMVAPDIVPEADGEIAIEWHVAPRRTFSISIGESGPLHYAGLFGPDEEVHGVSPFTDSVSATFLRHIAEVVRDAGPSRD